MCSKPVLPIEMELIQKDLCDDHGVVNMKRYLKGMTNMRDELFKDAKGEITQAQFRQKQDYDKKHGRKKVIHAGIYIIIITCIV
jgi:hypothetical protein